MHEHPLNLAIPHSAGKVLSHIIFILYVPSADEDMAEGPQLQLECWQHRYAHMLHRPEPPLATFPKSTLCMGFWRDAGCFEICLHM